MKNARLKIAVVLLVFAGTAGAAGNGYKHGHDKRFAERHDELYDYAEVVDVQPLYREVRVSEPVRECWDEPVYRTEHRRPKSAGGMLAGGIIGGIVGHQIGKGRGQKVATAVGTLIGASIGHDAVNGDSGHYEERVVGYEEHCKIHHRVRHEQVVDGYDVTYIYRGKTHQVVMPYDPGERLKMRIRITPVF